MKNYDDEVAKYEGVTRPFTLRGVEFVAKPVMPAQHLSALADMQTGADSSHAFETTVSAIRATLLPAYRQQWDDLLDREHDIPIGLATLMKIADDLVEETTGRPPTPPTPSGSTDAAASTRSTDGSVSTAVPASAASIRAQG